MIYVLLDGVGDLPHPDLDGKTPLEAANTPILDKIASNGAIGEVISVGKGIAPESDIAVFNMLGYKFKHEDWKIKEIILDNMNRVYKFKFQLRRGKRHNWFNSTYDADDI